MDFSVVRMCFYSAGSGGLFWYIHRLFVQCSRRREHKAYANEASASTGNCRDIFCCGLPFFLRLSVASRGYRCSFPNHNHLGSGVWMVCDAIYTLPALRIFFPWPHIYTVFFSQPQTQKENSNQYFCRGTCATTRTCVAVIRASPKAVAFADRECRRTSNLQPVPAQIARAILCGARSEAYHKKEDGTARALPCL